MSGNINHRGFSSFNFDGVKINGTKAGMSGMKFGNLQDAHGERIRVETPVMKIAWNAEPRTPRDQPDGNISAKLALSFSGKDSEGGEKMKSFHDFLKRIDARVLELVKAKKGEFWTKNIADSKIDSVYVTSIKEPTDEKYAPTFTAKIPLEDNPSPESGDPKDLKIMKMNVFNTSKKPIPPTECMAGCMASAIVEASYIWCSPAMVGVTWTVKHVLVKPKKNEEEFQFTNMDDFEGDDESDGDTASSTASSVASSTTGEHMKRKRDSDETY